MKRKLMLCSVAIFWLVFANIFANAETIKGASEVVYSDGIDKKEAIIIAKKYMLDNGLDYDWKVNSARLMKDEKDSESWAVNFTPLENGWGSGRRPESELKFQHLMPYLVFVNKQSGAIGVMKIEEKEGGMSVKSESLK